MIKTPSKTFDLSESFLCLLIICLLATINACSSRESVQLESHLGLYKLVDKKCSVPDNAFNPCDNTLFIELVKGQFIGVPDSEIAYVFWSGDPAIDPELQYTAHLIEKFNASQIADNRYWLNNTNSTQEYFSFSKGKLSNYYLMHTSGNTATPRIIEYTLTPAQRSSEPRYRLNYPGNK